MCGCGSGSEWPGWGRGTRWCRSDAFPCPLSVNQRPEFTGREALSQGRGTGRSVSRPAGGVPPPPRQPLHSPHSREAPRRAALPGKPVTLGTYSANFLLSGKCRMEIPRHPAALGRVGTPCGVGGRALTSGIREASGSRTAPQRQAHPPVMGRGGLLRRTRHLGQWVLFPSQSPGTSDRDRGLGPRANSAAASGPPVWRPLTERSEEMSPPLFHSQFCET